MLLPLDIELVVSEVVVVELATRHLRTLPHMLKTLHVVSKVEGNMYEVRHGPRSGGCTAANAGRQRDG